MGVGLFTVAAALAQEAPPSKYRWDGVPRVVAIGDVHGSYDKLLELLRGTGLVDEQLTWAGGKDHLVFVGDLIDRGPDDREVMDLVMRLQTEAEAAGGRVHALLGNHEVMNLSSDLRYVSEKGMRDFLPEEDRKARNRAMQRFRSSVAPGMPLADLRPAFEKRFPPGYFGRQTELWHTGIYGKWLIEQPAVIIVNDVVFVHGGLTDEFTDLGLERINEMVRESILDFAENARELVQVTGAPPSYADALKEARDLGSSTDRSKRAAVAREVLALKETLPYVPSGPLWYRGVSTDPERLERISVENALADLGAKTLVVAHTPTASGRINSRFNNTVFRVDVGMAYGREPLALVFEGEETKVYDPANDSYGPFVVELPHGEGTSRFSEQLPEAQLLEFLREATIEDCQFETRGVRYANICTLEQNGVKLRAVFQTVDEKEGSVAETPATVPRTWRNEVASFLIDRLLDLDLVPATVERTHQGETGSMQLWLEAAVDEKLLETYDQTQLLSGLEEELIRAEAFMALIDVYKAYEAVGIMLLPLERRLQVADNTKAFSTSLELNPNLMTPPCGPIREDRELFLRSLTHQDIKDAAGRYLSDAQIDALLARRDRFLEKCVGHYGSMRPSE